MTYLWYIWWHHLGSINFKAFNVNAVELFCQLINVSPQPISPASKRSSNETESLHGVNLVQSIGKEISLYLQTQCYFGNHISGVKMRVWKHWTSYVTHEWPSLQLHWFRFQLPVFSCFITEHCDSIHFYVWMQMTCKTNTKFHVCNFS